MASLGATAVISTSVPMRNWARLRVTGAGGGDDFEMGMIAQAVKNGIQASRKRAAWRCIGSESSKEQTQCHGGKRVQRQKSGVRVPFPYEAIRSNEEVDSDPTFPTFPLFRLCYNGAAMK